MALGPYSLCPCGSGKQFKWCCQAIHAQIEKAFTQDANGQHEAALKTMQEIVAAHPNNPEVHGRQAQLLFQLDRAEEAEAAIDRALAINPNYAFGYNLRGQFRYYEGELPGALLLFRKAVDLYHPETHQTLAALYSQIGECELRLNRPVAARAAVELAIRHDGTNRELRQLLEDAFGEGSGLPLAARRAYCYRSSPADASADRKARWEKALASQTTGRLSDVRKAFEELTAGDEHDPAAWFNLGLTRAWLGDNGAALEALDRYLELENDAARAIEAATLASVLRCGYGLELTEADICGRVRIYRVVDPQRVVQTLQQLAQEKFLVGVQVDQERNILTGLLLEKPQVLAGGLENRLLRIGAHIAFDGRMVQVANADGEMLAKTLQEFEQAAGSGLGEHRDRRVPAQPLDLLAEAMVFPGSAKTDEEARAHNAQGMQRYYEEVWIHQPLRSLRGVPPLDAAGHAVLRKKLLGVIEHLAQCAAARGLTYDFNQLRRKLGLLEPAAVPSAGAAAPVDIPAMSMAELSQLPVDTLTEEQLDLAAQTAQKLDAPDLAAYFLRILVSRPPGGRSDRWPWYNQLIAKALREGRNDVALDHVNEGEKFDGEHNEGRRRNDYELRRAQVHAKRGEIEAAVDVFDRLIARAPEEYRFRSSAAEAMLSARQPARALKYAEDGLALARQQNNRDSESYFLELAGAAKKQGG